MHITIRKSSGHNERFLNNLADDNVNIDELNYLMKRFDGFQSRGIETETGDIFISFWNYRD